MPRRSAIRCTSGASAAEFALVLPVALLFFFGIIDAGRFGWEVNRAEKATQIGARWAVATDIIPGGDATTGLKNYSFAISSAIPQGTAVPKSAFPGVTCQTTGATATSPVACACKAACPFTVGIDTTAQNAWDALIDRMQDIYPNIGPQNVRIDYDWSGLGYSGDPNGADVAPLVTVRLRTEVANRLQFQPITLFLFNSSLPMPSFSYTITMEDGQGTFAN